MKNFLNPGVCLFILSSVVLTSRCGPGVSAGCKSDANPAFSRDIVNTSQILGVLAHQRADSGEIKAHSNIRLSVGGSSGAVYAPADMELMKGAKYSGGANVSGVNAPAAYLLHFRVSCEVDLWLDHIHNPTGKIADALGGGITSGTSLTDIGGIYLKAGEQIGYAEESATNASNFDFGVANAGIAPMNFVNAQKYKDAQNYMKLYADCPYRYFANAQTYLSKGIDSDGTAAPNYSCDRRDQDKSGTISGAWFTPGDIFYGLGISLEPSGTNVRISGLSGSSYMIHSGGGNFTDPKTVTYEVCYFTGSTYAYFHLNSATSLSVIYNSASGTCPGSYGAASGSTYQFER